MNPLHFSRQVAYKINNSSLFSQPAKYLSSAEYAKKFDAKWHKVYDRMPSKRSPPVYYSALKVDIQKKLDAEFPEAGVLELNNPLLYGQAGLILSKEGYLLLDHSWYSQHAEEVKKTPRYFSRNKSLKGVCLSLASDFAVGSYGHFLLDCLSRLELFNKAGFKLIDIDYVFCPKPPSKTAQRLFDKLGIPASKCIWADENKNMTVQVETLLAPTFPGTRRNYPEWLPAFIQREFLPYPLPVPSRRLYISRAGCRRNVVNEEAIIRILIQHGFEIYNPSQETEQPRDFAESAVVVGAHGGGLADLVFCQPGTKVLELIPTDHVYPYYYSLSDAAKLDYGCLICRSTDERGEDAFGPSHYNFHVNEDEFNTALAQITNETSFNRLGTISFSKGVETDL